MYPLQVCIYYDYVLPMESVGNIKVRSYCKRKRYVANSTYRRLVYLVSLEYLTCGSLLNNCVLKYVVNCLPQIFCIYLLLISSNAISFLTNLRYVTLKVLRTAGQFELRITSPKGVKRYAVTLRRQYSRRTYMLSTQLFFLMAYLT